MVDLISRALFGWWFFCGSLFVAYPSDGVVKEVCINGTVCHKPTNSVGDVWHVDEVFLVSIWKEVNGRTIHESLWGNPLTNDGGEQKSVVCK